MATADDVAKLFLQDIGAPQTPDNIRSVKVWLANENTNPTLRNNPWNLHSYGGLPGQTGYDYVNSHDQNVAVFSTLDAGVLANANNLMNLSRTYPEYGKAVQAWRLGQSRDALAWISASPWAESHYRINGVPGTSALLQVFDQGGQGNFTVGDSGSGTTVSATPNAWNNVLDLLTVNDHGWKTWLDALSNSPFFGGIQQARAFDKPGTFYSSTNPDTQAVLDALAATGIDPNTPMNSADAKKIETWLSQNHPSGPTTFTGGGNAPSGVLGDIFSNVQGALIFLGVILVGIVFIGTGGLIALRKQSA